MPHSLEPFQLDFAIPEIGAEVGDWITLDRGTNPPQLVLLRRIPHSSVTRVRRHWEGLGRFLSHLPHHDPSRCPRQAIRRLK